MLFWKKRVGLANIKKKKSLLFTKKGNILETIKNLFFAKLSPVKIAATQSHFFFSFGPLQLINFMIKKNHQH